MPPREPRPEPLARALARVEFDALVLRRCRALDGGGERATAGLVEALARSFADQVDRENSTRGILRTGVAIEYVDAVVLTGSAGALVVDAPEYDERSLYWRARAGVIEDGTILRGRHLDGYLRTGEQGYAEKLGLQ
jgi:hypothetical protein